MAAIEKMELVHDNGFRRRMSFTLFDVARDKAPGAVAPDDKFIAGILNGEVNITNLATAVVVVNADPLTADDASLKATVETVWPFFATAWAVAPRVI